MISGAVWAMSALSIVMVVIFVYFLIFFSMMLAIFLPVAYFWRVVFKFLNFRSYDTF